MMTGTLPGEPLEDGDVGRNALGAMTMFTPVLATAARPLPDGAVEDLVLTGATGALNALAALSGTEAGDVLNFERVILYGVELATRNRDGQLESSILFDVETAMSLDLKLGSFRLLQIPRTNPITARYKALGVRLSTRDNEQPFSFRPVFDSSRGYTIDIGRPGAIQLADPLGKIMKVLGARVARTNPLSFEIDVGLGIDLGVVSVDRLGVRLRLDPWGDPELTDFGVSVNIPGAFKGSGFLQLGHTPDGHSSMAGGLDLTLVPLRLRIAAKIKIEQFAADNGETKTGVLTSIDSVGGVDDWLDPEGDWPPAGRDWKAAKASDNIRGIRAVTIQSPSPAASAKCWGELLEAPVDGANVRLTGAAIRFVPPVDADGTGVVALDVAVRDPKPILAAARAQKLATSEASFRVCGISINLVPA